MQPRRTVFPALAALAIAGVGLSLVFAERPVPSVRAAASLPPGTEGTLVIIDKEGRSPGVCPLKHTDVQADISGFLARVKVTQEFENPLPEKVEAVYVFPLPSQAAVDDMTMLVGDRTIRGLIKRREEARKIFEEARQKGHTASLLDQERPNIFTQSVTNIGPGMKVKVVISYVETLKYEEGSYEFSFPMVVGPRYIPGSATGRSGGGWAPDTDRVPDASRITPPVARPGARAGHDISLRVNVDAGVPIDGIACKTHLVDSDRPDARRAVVRLRNEKEIPNKDFVLRYDVAGRKIEDAILTHRAKNGGFFTLILQPPERVTPAEVTPKEIVFVLDTSGSMSGFPIEKSKEVIKLAMDGLHPRDTFNFITFAGDTHILFPQPVPATPENVRKAQQFLLSRSGGGGTEMMKAIRAALDPSDQQDHIRVVCFLTDGYVGNDMEIIGEVKKHPNARVFSFGVGSSVNRFLLDKMAEEGRGEVEYVALNGDGSAAARRFHERVRTPLLTDIAIDWGGLPVTDVYPKRVPDLFSAKPVVLTGRYTAPARASIRLKGKLAGREMTRAIPVDLPADQPARDVLATLWARTKIDHLMSQDWTGVQHGNPLPEIREQITTLGLDFRLMTQFTSFVAVEDTIVLEGGKPRRIEVPVEMPHGVSYEGVFGETRDEAVGFKAARSMVAPAPSVFRERASPSLPASEPRADSISKLATKLDGQLIALRLALRSGDPAHSFRLFYTLGKAHVKIWLVDDSPAVIEELKKLGVEIVEQRPGKLLLARVAPDKLEQLAAMKPVLYVSADLGLP